LDDISNVESAVAEYHGSPVFAVDVRCPSCGRESRSSIPWVSPAFFG
jgi:hypothetical protein